VNLTPCLFSSSSSFPVRCGEAAPARSCGLTILYACALESFYDTFHNVADMMYFCQMLALVETLNAAIGVTSTPVLPALIQVWKSYVWEQGMKDFSMVNRSSGGWS
jgi:hypothetical protein